MGVTPPFPIVTELPCTRWICKGKSHQKRWNWSSGDHTPKPAQSDFAVEGYVDGNGGRRDGGIEDLGTAPNNPHPQL